MTHRDRMVAGLYLITLGVALVVIGMPGVMAVVITGVGVLLMLTAFGEK